MENRKTKIISMIAIIALVLTVITATYAYFQAQTGEGSQTDVKITANTVDTLTFEAGRAISLSLDQENFAKGTGNQIGTTFAKAILTANNKTNSATEHYYLYLYIDNNTFSYTQGTDTPEILLTIKDGSNNEITSINGLTHKTVTDASGASISGFDITNKNGLITLLDNKEITTTSSITENWNVTATYINYDADQSKNAGKDFTGKIIIQKESVKRFISDVCQADEDLGSCIQNLAVSGDSEITKIYYREGKLIPSEFVYSGGSSKVNNYICIGSAESPCPTNNLFRIIGYLKKENSNDSFDVKVISAVPLFVEPWDNGGSNTWSTSSLKTFLNQSVYSDYSVVSHALWYDVGLPTLSIANKFPLEIAATETRGWYGSNGEYGNVGLPKISEYAFASSPNFWSKAVDSLNANDLIENNWMFESGASFWTIIRANDNNESVFGIIDGKPQTLNVGTSISVKPTFNIFADYSSGTGEFSNPIRVKIQQSSLLD